MISLLAKLAIKIIPPIVIYLVVFFTAIAYGVDSTIATIIAAASAFGTFVVTIRI